MSTVSFTFYRSFHCSSITHIYLRTFYNPFKCNFLKIEVWYEEDALDVSNFDELIGEMAMEYPFELDVFQKRAVYRVENSQCVLVAAHTSAGKTVVAEYAIAKSLQKLMKCVFTSPIKALSNQKYKDFKEKFEDVGILTGDVTLNEGASCLIMTTEVLQSMLYRGSEVINDID